MANELRTYSHTEVNAYEREILGRTTVTICLKSTMKTPGQYVNLFKVINKDIRTTSTLRCFFFVNFEYILYCSGVSIVEFEQVNVG